MRVLATRIKLHRPVVVRDDEETTRDKGVVDRRQRWIRRLFKGDARKGVKEQNHKR